MHTPNDYFVLLDDATGKHACLFSHFQAATPLPPAALDQLDAQLHHGWQQGWHAVLWLPYEFGNALHRLPENTADTAHLSIFWFARQSVFNRTQTEHWLAQQDNDLPAGIAHTRSDTDHRDYLAAIDTIHQAIRRGDTYQINYTTRWHFDAYGHPTALYRRLRARQPVPYAALACLPQHNAQPPLWTLCLSPELFLQIDADGQIHTRPMKGTAPILHDGHDNARAEALRHDSKNRAENVMIVDLLRNDLGRIAQTGQVHVPHAFDVSAFGSVWQMTSTVTAQARPHTGMADILRATFPCGSITGAPKRMSMQIIQALETGPRGLYTGSIGHIAPCRSGLGFSGSLNVAIRTLQLQAHNAEQQHYRGSMGVGSGIVIDSQPQAEYEECHWKSGFLTRLPPQFELIETLAVEHGRCPLLPLHQQRLSRATHALHFDTGAEHIAQLLTQAIAAVPTQGRFRLKVQLQPNGHWQQQHASLEPLPETIAILLHPHNRIHADFLSRYKTGHRAAYDAAWQHAAAHQAFDTLLFDQHGHLLEGGRSNVFVRLNGHWHTPAASLPLLNGVMRQAVLADPQTHLGCSRISESHLHYRQIAAAEQIVLTNALRGVMRVRKIVPMALPSLSGHSTD